LNKYKGAENTDRHGVSSILTMTLWG